MKTPDHLLSDLHYQKEHLTCENYADSDRAIFEIIRIKAGKQLIREDLERTSLVFVLSGELDVSTGGSVCQRVQAQQILLVASGDNFYGRTFTDTTLLRCSFTQDMTMCNKFSISQLQKFLPKSTNGGGKFKPFSLLPIHPLLLKELETTMLHMQSGMKCIHFQEFKKEILFIELRALYPKEELATLFAPILSAHSDFKQSVLMAYPQTETAKELMEKLNMSPTVFKREFQRAFGMSARQWLIQKKKEKIIRDILMTETSITELAYKYRFTVNYMTTFCRKHYGKSPTELRQEQRN